MPGTAQICQSWFQDPEKVDVPEVPGVAVRTQILSVDNGSAKNVVYRSIEAKAPGSGGNVTVEIESQDVTPDAVAASKAKGAKVIPPPPTPPSKDDFVVQIKSVERVDGKKPIRPRLNATTPSKKVVEKKKSGLDIKVWRVTDAPKARDEVPPARLEYSKLWADDWGRELSSSLSRCLSYSSILCTSLRILHCCFLSLVSSWSSETGDEWRATAHIAATKKKASKCFKHFVRFVHSCHLGSSRFSLDLKELPVYEQSFRG